MMPTDGPEPELIRGQNAPYIRQHNRRLILHVLRTEAPLSRRRIAESTGLQPATVTNIVGELIAMGLAQEIGQSRSRSSAGGRPQVLVDLNANAAHVGGVYIGIRRIYVSIVDIKGTVLACERLMRPASTQGVARVAASTLRRLGRGVGVPVSAMAAIGLAVVVSATVRAADPETESVRLGAALAAILEAELGKPVLDDRGPVAMVLAESLFGAVSDARCILVHVGTTVSAGVQWGHRLFGRFGYWPSPIGHTIVDPDGVECLCGARGCLDTVASERYLADRAARAARGRLRTLLGTPEFDPRQRGSEAIGEAAAHGDALAMRLVDEAAGALGVAIANALQIINADTAVIAGPILTAGDRLLVPLRERVTALLAGSRGRRVRIVPTAFGLDAPFVAGPSLALDRSIFGPYARANPRQRAVALSARS